MRIKEILEANDYVIPSKSTFSDNGEWEFVNRDPGIDSTSIKDNPWMKNDPVLSDMAAMQKLNAMNGLYSELLAHNSPYNPQSQYSGPIGRMLYNKYAPTIKSMVMQGNTAQQILAYLQKLTGNRVRPDIVDLIMGKEPATYTAQPFNNPTITK